MNGERLSLDQRLRDARDDSRPVVLPAEVLYCRDYFDALSALTGSSESLKFYHEEIVKIEEAEGRDLPLFTVVTNLVREDKMELLYRILVEPFVELKRKEDDV
ncbi:MAG: hypothetical protein J1D85_08245 [Bacteroidales bacterium]|nr:hypothetical protein [Bacteroidales bacterium]